MRLPLIPRLLFRLLAPAAVREEVLGDLAEEWEERCGERGARRWLWSQLIRSAIPLARLRLRRRRAATEMRGHGRGVTMQVIRENLRYGIRALGRNWAFTALVVLTLGLGIGANAVIFSAVNGMVLNPFPFPEPERIVGVGTAYPRLGEGLGFWENLSPAEFEDVRDGTRLLEDVVSWDMGFREVETDGPPASTFTAFWWGNALETLGMTAHLGRGFNDQEIREGSRVALLSHRFWTTRFGADSTLLGRSVTVNGDPYTLVGILPEKVLIYGTDLWTPMPVVPSAYPRNRRQFQVLARVVPGATLQEVNTELEGISRRVEEAHGGTFEEYRGWRVEARRWTDVNVATLRTGAAVLMGAVGILLLLVCVNVANILLARATGRRQEMAVRSALGAGRGRLVGQLLTEAMVLSGVGGLLGMALAWAGTWGIRRYLGMMTVPVPGDVTLDGTVLVFTVGLSLLTGIVFGLAPALQASGEGIRTAMGSGAGGSGSTGNASRQRILRVLVGGEVAVALILLVTGALLVRSLASLSAVDPGWETEDVLTLRVTLPPQRYTPGEVQAFFPALLNRLEDLPGVLSAGTATQFPGRVFSRSEFAVGGRTLEGEETLPAAFTTLVSSGFFETVGARVLRGRLPSSATDGPDDPPVAVLNDAAARAFFPGEDPLGRRIRLGESWIEIVGVVADTRNRGLDQPPAPEIFASQEQLGGPNQFFFLIRSQGDPMALVPAVRAALAALDPAQPLYGVQTADQVYADQVAPRRATAILLAIFAFFALMLAAAGIYGVVSWSVASRSREMGVRLALGAHPPGLRRMVVRGALVPVVLGLAAGLALSFGPAQLLGDMLHGVGSADLPTRAVVAVLLLAVALTATWIPASRASRLDPARTLKEE